MIDAQAEAASEIRQLPSDAKAKGRSNVAEYSSLSVATVWSFFTTVLGVALAVRLWVLWRLHFDGLYGQDAYAYYYYGVAFWHDHVFSYHWPWLSYSLPLYWPIGEPALVTIATAIVGHPSAMAAQMVSLLAGLGSVALTFLLALRVAATLLPARWRPWTAALAALLIALSGLEVQASGTIMADAPALFWGSAAIWLWTSHSLYTQHWTWRSTLLYFVAGVCFSLSVSTRFEYAPLGAALLAYWLVQKHRGRMALVGLVGAILTGVPQALYSLGYSDPVLHQEWLVSWSIAHLWQAHFATADGLEAYPMSMGAFYLVRPLLSPQSLPFVLAPFLLAGIVALQARSRHKSDQDGRASGPLLLMLLAWWLVPAIFLSGIAFESARFALIYGPPLAILEAVGLAAAVRWLQGIWHDALRAAVVLAVLGLGIMVADIPRPLAALASGKSGDLAAVSWLKQHTPPGATLVTFSLTLTLYHNGDLQRHGWTLRDLSALTPTDLRHLAHIHPLVLIANERNLATQWPGLPPENAFLWLSSHVRLRQVARVGGYTILER